MVMSLPILPIPEATRGRDGKYHDAARLYIHQRITDLYEVMRRTGLQSHAYLARVRLEDDWDGFAEMLAAQSMKSVWGDPAALACGWQADDFKRVHQERERQIAMLPDLVAERDRVVAVLKLTEVGSEDYTRLVNQLTKLNAELGHISGLDRFLAEVGYAKRAVMSQRARADVPRGTSPDQPRVAKGVIVELG